MGHGSYTSADWMRLKTSAKITKTSDHGQIFKRTSMDERFDPKYIHMREARDSEDHPDSTPVIIGLDVTGSMGYLAAQIAKESLHETMMKLFSTKPVKDPQLMFAAIGDVLDNAPLQVTQFESDIRIAQQLLDLWLEGHGGDGPEDYPLLWYFAAHHISADSFEKHDKKGYLFTIGDADCHAMIESKHIKKIFSDHTITYSASHLAKDASAKFELFHIHIGRKPGFLPENLNKAIPGRILTIQRNEVDKIPEVIVSAMLLNQGRDRKEVMNLWSDEARPVVEQAVSKMVAKEKRGFFF